MKVAPPIINPTAIPIKYPAEIAKVINHNIVSITPPVQNGLEIGRTSF